MSVIEPRPDQLQPDLLRCARLILNDECPPERHMQLCGMVEDHDGDCAHCWSCYLSYVANGRRYDPYAADRRQPSMA